MPFNSAVGGLQLAPDRRIYRLDSAANLLNKNYAGGNLHKFALLTENKKWAGQLIFCVRAGCFS